MHLFLTFLCFCGKNEPHFLSSIFFVPESFQFQENFDEKHVFSGIVPLIIVNKWGITVTQSIWVIKKKFNMFLFNTGLDRQALKWRPIVFWKENFCFFGVYCFYNTSSLSGIDFSASEVLWWQEMKQLSESLWNHWHLCRGCLNPVRVHSFHSNSRSCCLSSCPQLPSPLFVVIVVGGRYPSSV